MAVAALAQVSGEPLIRWVWVRDHLDDITSRGLEHVQLTVGAVAVGFAIAFPLAILAHRKRWLIAPSTWITGVLYTIPSLAFISFFISITGISLTTVLIPLIAYSLLILFRNTLAGLEGVDADVKEAATGMGFSRRQLLWRVEVPLALPVIVAGLRVATVSSIGLVTIAALIGRGGFGQFILLGLNQFFPTPLLLGSVLSILLAIVADLLLLGVQRLVAPWVRGAEGRVLAT